MILGILLRRRPGATSPFGSHSGFVEQVAAQAAALGASVVAFDPAQYDGASDRLAAIRPPSAASRSWQRRSVPLPDVLWDRTFRWGGEHLTPFLERSIPLINKQRLNKWASYRLLVGAPACRRYLPETRLLTDLEGLAEMLRHHQTLFIKPISGSAGRGIVRVTPGWWEHVRLHYISTRSGQLREVEVNLPRLRRWVEARQGSYIIQEGLDLCAWEGVPADIRTLVQKDGGGRWRLTGMGVRVASPGRFTTNLHTGGRSVPLESLLARLGLSGLEEVLARASLAVAAALDRGAGPLGELGLDFGLNAAGRIWLIEQNGQPGRSIFARLNRPDLTQTAFRRPVEYAAFLAGQRPRPLPPLPFFLNSQVIGGDRTSGRRIGCHEGFARLSGV